MHMPLTRPIATYSYILAIELGIMDAMRIEMSSSCMQMWLYGKFPGHEHGLTM